MFRVSNQYVNATFENIEVVLVYLFCFFVSSACIFILFFCVCYVTLLQVALQTYFVSFL